MGDGAAGSNLFRGVNFASISENLSVGDDWCEDRENRGKRNSETNILSPVQTQAGKERIIFGAEVDIKEEQDDTEGSENGGTILKKGHKFSSADEYLSFMEDDQPDQEETSAATLIRRSGRKPESVLVKKLLSTTDDSCLGIEVFDTDYRGRGIKASRRFVRGDYVVEYAGDLLSVKDTRLGKPSTRVTQPRALVLYLHVFLSV